MGNDSSILNKYDSQNLTNTLDFTLQDSMYGGGNNHSKFSKNKG